MARESALTSGTLYQLSDGGERLFWRLMLVADDFGRFEAEPQILKARCFPRWPDTKMSARRVAKLYAELETDLVQTYIVDGVAYGYFATWEKHQRCRARASKFPEPTADARTTLADICQQMLSRAGSRGHLRPETETETKTKSEAEAEAETEPAGDAAARPTPAVEFKIPEPILSALNRAPKLGKIARLYEPSWWQAILRAYPGVDYAYQILDAESFLAAHPHYRDFPAFLRNSIKRAYERGPA